VAVLAEQILAALPQTQCTRCGYPDCAAYAQAIAQEGAPINQCPPGGSEGIIRLAQITGQAVAALNPQFGSEGPRTVAVIDENWCIGCTLCIAACPTDAIVGSHKRMHTVIEAYCTGCDLCLPVCPVDCIAMENVSGNAIGWDAWLAQDAEQARTRYTFHRERTSRDKAENQISREEKAQQKLQDLSAPSTITDPQLLDQKRSIIEAAMQRARLKAGSGS
jgi:Na+-translocating ferredoxin:NAD+ oxidoreductase subunit B